MAYRFLIVEDDELVQSLLAAYMKGEGYKVSYAGTGKEMLATLNAEKIDLILLNLGLPDEDGLTLTRQIRARSAIPIIVITARQAREDRLAALELGADDYLTKPFDPEELVLRVHNILGRSMHGGAGGGGGNRLEANVIESGGWKIDGGAGQGTQQGAQPGLSFGRGFPKRRRAVGPADRCVDLKGAQKVRRRAEEAESHNHRGRQRLQILGTHLSFRQRSGFEGDRR
jgi:DNA-binding response OmpR family regulator